MRLCISPVFISSITKIVLTLAIVVFPFKKFAQQEGPALSREHLGMDQLVDGSV